MGTWIQICKLYILIIFKTKYKYIRIQCVKKCNPLPADPNINIMAITITSIMMVSIWSNRSFATIALRVGFQLLRQYSSRLRLSMRKIEIFLWHLINPFRGLLISVMYPLENPWSCPTQRCLLREVALHLTGQFNLKTLKPLWSFVPSRHALCWEIFRSFWHSYSRRRF